MAVYFDYKNRPAAFACDKWTSVEDNIWAICLTVNALRQIERSGASELLERAFRGFDALLAPAGASWWAVLDVAHDASLDEIKSAYREQVKRHHPDVGGDREKFEEIQAAYESAVAAKG